MMDTALPMAPMVRLKSCSDSSVQAIARKRWAFAATKGSPARTVSTMASSRFKIPWFRRMATRPRTATARSPRISRSASGEGERLNELRIHRSWGRRTT